jgi:hypothetical protein
MELMRREMPFHFLNQITRFGLHAFLLIMMAGSFLVGISQNNGANPRVSITSASINYSSGVLTVVGTNLGQAPTVLLGRIALSNVSSNGTILTATVPTGVLTTPGTYLLTVTRGASVTDTGTFEVAIGAQGPQGPSGPGVLRVYDSKNVLVGNVLAGYIGDVIVVYRLNNLSIPLSVSKNKIAGSLLAYTTNNCTGTPYIDDGENSIMTPNAIVGSSLYIPDFNSPRQTITYASLGGATTSSDFYCTGHIPTTDFARPAIEIPHFTDQFTPPFTVR